MVSFTLLIFFLILELRFTNTSWPDPQGEGEQMVTDFQDLSATFEDQLAQSNVFCTSSQVLTLDSQDNEEEYASDDEEGLRSEDNDREDDADDSENGEVEEDITPDGRNTGRSNHRPITQSLRSTSAKERIDIKYVESDSDLCDDEEYILLHDDHNIPSDGDDDEDDEAMGDDESTPKWKLNLRTCSTFFIT